MNNLDKQYQALLQDILDNGVEKKDRTGTGTLSVFSRQIRHKMSDGFPLLTTKKMAFKTMVTELLWFLRGDTNIKYLVDNDCHIWDGDAYKNYLNKHKDDLIGYTIVLLNGESAKIIAQHNVNRNVLITDKGRINIEGDDTIKILNDTLTQEEFINKIKTDDEFAKKWGELGPIYGKQWRSWTKKKMYLSTDGSYENIYDEMDQTVIDQISILINDLKTNPDSRRLMVNAWNVAEIEHMVLPPCHYGFQVYTRELDKDERCDIAEQYGYNSRKLAKPSDKQLDDANIPTRAISLMWNQRSVDTFLGLPFNIASYGLLLEIIAKEVNMIPDELIGNLGDVHLYSNHVEQAKEQIGRKLTVEERMDWWFKNRKPNRDVCDDVDIYSPYAKGVYFDSIGVPQTTREPFELPKLIINENNKMRVGGGIFTYVNTDFTIENYQSHSAIKAPLSN